MRSLSRVKSGEAAIPTGRAARAVLGRRARIEVSDVLRIVAKLPNVAPGVQLVLTKRAQEI
jgi:hypothetical protein